MERLVERLLHPACRDQALTEIETQVRHAPVHADNLPDPADPRRRMLRVDLVHALLDHAIRAYVPTQQVGPHVLSELTALVARRMDKLREDMVARADGQDRSLPDAMRMATLQGLAAHVDAIPRKTDLSVAEIDEEITDVMQPMPGDWGEVRQEAEALRNRAVFELVRLRKGAERIARLDIPDLGVRVAHSNQARDTLMQIGVDRETARRLVAALRHGDVPHVRFVD